MDYSNLDEEQAIEFLKRREQSNYPDLYPDFLDEKRKKGKEEQESNEFLSLTPGRGIYKEYIGDVSKTLVTEEIEVFSKEIIKVNQFYKTYLEANPKEDDHDDSRILLGIQIFRFFSAILENYIIESFSTTTVNINIRDNNNNQSETNQTDQTISKLKAKLANLQRKLNKAKKEDKKAKIIKYQSEIEAIQIQISEIQSQKGNGWIRFLLGGISSLAFPLLGHFSAKHIALYFYTRKMKKSEKLCSSKLNYLKKNEEGDLNPHVRLLESTIQTWQRGAKKLLFHTKLLLLANSVIGIGACLGLFGAFKNSSPRMFQGTLIFSLGLGAALFERARFSVFDQELVKESLSESASCSQKLLDIKEPFMLTSVPPNNPEWKK